MQLSRTRFNQYVRALSNTSTLAQNELWQLLQNVNPDSPYDARDFLLLAVPTITNKYGNISALVASEYYDEIRSLAKTPYPYTSTLAETVSIEQVESSVRYASRHLFNGNKQAAMDYLNGVIDKYVKQPARDTIALNSSRDPAKPKFARVPTGSKTCAWCLMLAGRGFVYSSAKSAGKLGQYHKACDCQPVPSFGDDRLKGYDPKALEEMYEKAIHYDEHGHADLTKTLANMREMYPTKVSDGVGEVRVSHGATPLQKELLTANRLTAKGYNIEFLPVSNVQGKKNADANIDGSVWEIKAPSGSSKNTIDNNLKKAMKQSTSIVVDNNFSGLSDEEALTQLRRSLSSRAAIAEILFIEKSGIIWHIKNE